MTKANFHLLLNSPATPASTTFSAGLLRCLACSSVGSSSAAGSVTIVTCRTSFALPAAFNFTGSEHAHFALLQGRHAGTCVPFLSTFITHAMPNFLHCVQGGSWMSRTPSASASASSSKFTIADDFFKCRPPLPRPLVEGGALYKGQGERGA